MSGLSSLLCSTDVQYDMEFAHPAQSQKRVRALTSNIPGYITKIDLSKPRVILEKNKNYGQGNIKIATILALQR